MSYVLILNDLQIGKFLQKVYLIVETALAVAQTNMKGLLYAAVATGGECTNLLMAYLPPPINGQSKTFLVKLSLHTTTKTNSPDTKSCTLLPPGASGDLTEPPAASVSLLWPHIGLLSNQPSRLSNGEIQPWTR